MFIKSNKSLNFSKNPRSLRNIRYLIIHYSGMQSGRVSMKKLKSPKSKVSCHYFIERNGDIYRMVNDNRIAWHAGKSKWMNINNLNKYSIGIEISNPGHKHGYQNFSIRQIKSLVKLSKYLIKKYKIKSSNILGHSDIAFERKKDPGEKFPWKNLASKKIGIWHKIEEKKLKKFRKKKISNIEMTMFIKYLNKIGYFTKEII